MAEPVSAGQNTSGSFASILASITRRGRDKDSWDDSALADDVINLSYEEALRSVRGVHPEPRSDSKALSTPKAISHNLSAGKPRKTASVTIRLSESEQVQLRDRAAEAKLSLSEYLRSCIFEAETLRAQVKEALAQMQTAGAEERPVPKPFPRRRFRLFAWNRNPEA
jgi:hypothetical protein